MATPSAKRRFQQAALDVAQEVIGDFRRCSEGKATKRKAREVLAQFKAEQKYVASFNATVGGVDLYDWVYAIAHKWGWDMAYNDLFDLTSQAETIVDFLSVDNE